MRRMRDDFEAYFDDYDGVTVYIAKNFYNGNSDYFHLKDDAGRIIPTVIQTKEKNYENGYSIYQLKLDEDLEVGREYRIYNEFGRYAYCHYGHIVKTEQFTKRYIYEGDDLGCTYTKKKTTFKLWSPVAFRIQLQVIKDGIVNAYEMIKDDDGIFSYTVYGDMHRAKYSFLVRNHGRWNEIRDPYTSFSTTNGKYSEVIDINMIRKPKKYALPEMKSNCDAIIYEANIRDMTSQKGLKLQYPSTFKGFVEENATTIKKEVGYSYLKTLGITHVQLMPVFDFGSVDEEHPEKFYNWGYDPVQFRVLDGSYTKNPEDSTCRVQEFIDMVETLHKDRIRVTLDLVFNHVFTKKTFDLDRLIPDYYFLMNHDGVLSNGSFCGNDIDIQVPMARKYFLDTIRRIIEWFDVDGFRFDLMGILDITFMNEVVSICKEYKKDFMVYGEGWNMPSFLPEYMRASQQNQIKMPEVAHFSDRFREVIRGSNYEITRKGYASGQVENIQEARLNMSALCNDFTYDSPTKVVNYVECHDNHTLWDKNLNCCFQESEKIRKKRQVLTNAMVLLAQGIPFIHAGQEFGRTKRGIGNSYNKSDTINKMDYHLKDRNKWMVDQFKELVKIRKEHSCFRLDNANDVNNMVHYDYNQNQMLVYDCFKADDHCMAFFNPTSNEYEYKFNETVRILFDNGENNDVNTTQIKVAPFSVVVLTI